MLFLFDFGVIYKKFKQNVNGTDDIPETRIPERTSLPHFVFYQFLSPLDLLQKMSLVSLYQDYKNVIYGNKIYNHGGSRDNPGNTGQ